jgi:hypothetical protein
VVSHGKYDRDKDGTVGGMFMVVRGEILNFEERITHVFLYCSPLSSGYRNYRHASVIPFVKPVQSSRTEFVWTVIRPRRDSSLKHLQWGE